MNCQGVLSGLGDWVVLLAENWYRDPPKGSRIIFELLVGGFKYFVFSSLLGEMIQFD